MLATLGLVAREAREAAGLTQERIAAAAGVSDAVVSNLELGYRYPERLDEVISAYESEIGLESGTLWKRAAEKL
jgi:transcriptional regulator with XRE-family HTH domain